MEYFTVTLVQSNIIWENPEGNVSHIEDLLKDHDCGNLIVLPEMFTSGFMTHPTQKIIDFAEDAVQWMKKTAAEKQAAVCGSMIVNDSVKLFNRFVFVEPSGQIYHYDKKHLFSMGLEDELFSSGIRRVTIPYLGLNIRPYICYDLRFPVWNRNSYNNKTGIYEYDMLIFVANWPEQRIQHWGKLLQARAIENQAWVCGVNRVGTDENGITYSGSTMLVNPQGEIIARADNYVESLITSRIRLNELTDIRKNLPFARDWENNETD